MGRTFSPAVTSTPVIVDPDESHDEMYPHYPSWSYENAWDPDSDAFFKDAVYEAFVPALPLEPNTPVESSDGSSLDSSGGRETPAELPVPRAVHISNQIMETWLEGTTTGSNTTARANGPPPPPPPRRHSTSELRRGAPQSHFVSSAAFERFYTRQLNRARDSQRLPALVAAAVAAADDGDSDAEAPVALRPGVSVRTSEISPIQLPSSQARAAISLALQHQQQQQQQQVPRLTRPLTPPPASTYPSVPVLSTMPGGEAMQPSPPPSVSPRIYNWTAAARSAPESPTLPSRIRVTPARWPVY
jgi:hypothetical protein